MIQTLHRGMSRCWWPAVGMLVPCAAWAQATCTPSLFVADVASPACSDSGPGTEEQPYCSLAAAIAARGRAGVTIVVKPGVYRESITVPVSGAPEEPFTIQALPGASIDGSDDFSDPAAWIPASPPVHLASAVSWAPRQVFVDGARLAESAEPPPAIPAGTFRHVQGEGLYVNLGGDNPGGHQTFVGRRPHAFRITGRSWVVVHGFGIMRTEDIALYVLQGSSDVLLEGNSVSDSGGAGAAVNASSNVAIRANRVTGSANHGIYVLNGATGTLVVGNESQANARPSTDGATGLRVESAPGTLIAGNRLHHNQDSGLDIVGSAGCLVRNNLSWSNGDHGFHHIASPAVVHAGGLAWGNQRDGFSFEGMSHDGAVHNSIAADNGVLTGRFNLMVDASSAPGFTGNANVFWMSTGQPIVRFASTPYTSLAAFTTATGNDADSSQADPRWADPGAGDFALRGGSPAVDSAHSQAPGWPATDAGGVTRVQDPAVPDTGQGPVTYADRGPLESIESCNGGAGPMIPGCLGLDDDCDGVPDVVQPPAGTPLLTLHCGPSGTGLMWTALPSATGYDAVRGGLGLLTASHGEFSSAGVLCLASDTSTLSLGDPGDPPPGDAFWFLVRGGNCAGKGTYDTAASSQAAPRDAGIAASGTACP
ncbi:MAG TPA: right-handed parallel beta-helix repeat-containing protein [Candidatus Polarisedimenticolia bacterium]|nr:right-handed parallel beta-helix repeat-containing protein [Candidatus Polarisedimenticolia bacterium]